MVQFEFLYCNVALTVTSDSRIKTNTAPIKPECLCDALSVDCCTYTHTVTGQQRFGTIAQNIPSSIAPYVVSVKPTEVDAISTQTKFYNNLISVGWTGPSTVSIDDAKLWMRTNTRILSDIAEYQRQNAIEMALPSYDPANPSGIMNE